MGQIGEVIKTEKSTLDDGSELVDVVVDPGGGANLKIAHFADAGDDSKPLPGDFCASEDGGEGTGTQQSTGYHDAKNASKSAEGEKRIYSRTPAGLPAAEIWLKKDGTVEINGLLIGGGKAKLDPLTGEWDFNGLKIDKDGNLTTPGEITAKDATPTTAVKLSTHLHGTGVGPTTPPQGGT